MYSWPSYVIRKRSSSRLDRKPSSTNTLGMDGVHALIIRLVCARHRHKVQVKQLRGDTVVPKHGGNVQQIEWRRDINAGHAVKPVR